MLKKRPLTAYCIIGSILILGIAEILTQLVVIREFLAVFYGNELVIGILLANWLLISGIGSWAGRKASDIAGRETLLIGLHIIMAFLLPAYIAIIRNLHNLVFIRGELVGIVQVFITAFLILFPVCFITGFSLPLFSTLYRKKDSKDRIGSVYFFDSLSNIIGGLLFSFLLVYIFNAFQVALFVLLINLGAAVLMCARTGRRLLAIIPVALAVLALAVFFSFSLDRITTEQQFPLQHVVAVQDSIYGRLVVTETDGQYNFFDNGGLVFSSDDVMSAEEKVHFALQQHPSPKKVLLISGGYSGTAKEALKYSPALIDYVELNPYLMSAGKAYTENLDDNVTALYWMDPRLFVRTARRHYDAVIVDAPDPSTAMANRYYTEEFFSELRGILNRSGVVGVSISSGANYMNRETAQLDSAVYNALKKSFENVMLLPGDTMYMVASDAPLSYNRYMNITVPTEYVADYMQDRLDRGRIAYASDSISGFRRSNRDFLPVAYYYHLKFWLRQFSAGYLGFLALALALLVGILWRIRPVAFSVFSAGIAGISLELVIIIGFQILYGYVYHKLSIIITSFMIGLAVGAWFSNSALKKPTGKTVRNISMLIALYSLLLPLVLFLLDSVESSTMIMLSTAILFPVLTAVIGALVGALFPAAARIEFKGVSRTAGRLYFYDYAGACLGAILVSALLVPLLGIFNVCFLTALIAAISALLNNR